MRNEGSLFSSRLEICKQREGGLLLGREGRLFISRAVGGRVSSEKKG